MTAFYEDADGITTFNLFIPTVPQLRELGDPKVMATLDKNYIWRH